MAEHVPVSRLTAMIGEAVIHRALQPEREISVNEILEIWDRILNITEKDQEYKISVMLNESTYRMIFDFMHSQESSEHLNTVHPVISKVLVVFDDYNEEALRWLGGIPGIELVYDLEKFVEKAEGTIVFCDSIDLNEPLTINLTSNVLEKGIFLIAKNFGIMDLDSFSAIADAVKRSPISDGAGVLYLSGELICKPLNPFLKFGGKCDRATDMSLENVIPVDILNMLGVIGK
ncbi:hypothetical protein KAS31_00145 [Candidatus Parcubacteria bacterium]|nr:hypothetical protein [Candidatus Parcubacteria bacterium]